MITFRRLSVDVYLSRLFLLILAVSSLSAEVRAQSTIKVGYYDMVVGAGVAVEQEPPIIAAGFTPVQLQTLTAADLAGLHVLFVQNPKPPPLPPSVCLSTCAYGAEYLASLSSIQNAVSAGMVLVIHDRFVMGSGGVGARTILPGAPSIFASRSNSNNIDVSDAVTLVANGPGGMITNSNLDGGNFSNHGWVSLTMGAPAGRKGLLHTVIPNQAVTFSYPFGAGFVIYSTIPLDFYLKGSGSNPPRDNFKNIYAPNVLAYAGCGLRPSQPAVSVSAATGYYGGTATLDARLHCGSTNLAGLTVNFSLNGTSVGSAQTDASGTATLTNASLGATLDSAIAAGTYADGASASFAGAGLFTAASGTAMLTVDKAPATIEVVGGTFGYDGAPHAATGSVTGVFDESLDAPMFTYMDANGVTSESAPVNAGTYVITATSTETDNYLSTTVRSSTRAITITPAGLTVTANNKSRLYGGANPTLDGTIAGIQGQNNITVSYATEATSSSPVGTYEIVPTLLDPDGELANYETPTVVNGILTITPAPLTVTANNRNRLYGGTNPTFDGTIAGIQGQDNITASYATEATSSSPVGTYDIAPTLLDPDGRLANYGTPTVVNGVLTITPVPLTVTADDKERLAGIPNPALTVRYAGFVNGDTSASLDVPPTVTTTVVLGSPAGTYPIVASGALDSNYTINHVSGTLTISPEGRLHGAGFIDAGGARSHFVFEVREGTALGERGSVTLRIDHNDLLDPDDLFVSQSLTSVILSDNPDFTNGVDTVVFAGVGLWNGAGATFEAIASDIGEPGVGRDTLSITIRVGGNTVATVTGLLAGGNVQSTRLPGR